MGARDRPHGEQDRYEGCSRHRRVDQELNPGVLGAEPMRSDPRADDGGQQESGSDELGCGAPGDPSTGVVCGHASGHAHQLAHELANPSVDLVADLADFLD